MRIKVIVRRALSGGFWAEAISLQGCVAVGLTKEECVVHIKDAINLWFGSEQEVQAARRYEVVEIEI